MNRLVPLTVRALSFLAAAAITALIIFVHAADLSELGAHEVLIAGTGTTVSTVADAITTRPTIALAANKDR